MKKNFVSKLTQEFADNKRLYIPVVMLFFLGILIGTISALTSSSDADVKNYFDRFISAYPLQGAGRSEIFRLSLLNYLHLAALLWISGWFVWLLPLGAIQIGLKGFRTGFTIAYLLKCYQWRGFLLALMAILPQSIILIPALCFFPVYQIKFAADRRIILKGGASAVLKRQIYCHNLAMTSIFLLMLLLCALIEGYVIPTLLQPVCGLFI